MNFLRNTKVKTKLLFMAATFLISLIIVGFAGYYYLQNSNNKMNTMYKDRLLAIEYLEEAKSVYNSSNTDLFELMVTTDNKRKNELVQSINTKRNTLQKNINEYSNTKIDPFEVNALKQLNDNIAIADQFKVYILTLSAANRSAEAYAEYNKSLSPISQKIEKNLCDLTDYNVKDADKLNQQNEVDFTKAKFIIIGIILLALTIGILISIFIINLITKPIKLFEIYIEKVASGDLSEETLQKLGDVKIYNDEIGKLGYSIFNMRQKLWELLSKVSDASQQIAASSEEFNANVEESSMSIGEITKLVSTIAEGAEKQLNAVIDTSNVIQQMSVTIQQSDVNINEATKVAGKTLESTNNGEEAIDKTKEQMNNIKETVVELDGVVKKLGERSGEIGQIIETISSIAEQTNLLALNAAIEAARAGEQGRGFAVVADEVRKLAEKSKKATEKISKLISEIQKDTKNAVSAMYEGTNQVKIGMEVVEKAEQAFKNILILVHQITNGMQEISVTSQNIEIGSQQVVSSMSEVDSISKDVSSKSQSIATTLEEQTAAMHEIASSSEGLSKIAENLMVEVTRFKL